MKKYDTILFDWDGTIVRTLDVWLEYLRLSLEKRGYNFSDKQIGANYSLFAERAISLGIDNVAEILVDANYRLKEYSKPTPMYDGVFSTLEYLRAEHKKIAVVTTSTHKQVDPLLKHHGLENMFDAVICDEDVVNQKPNSEPLMKAIDISGGNIAKTVMIGDSATDLQAAENTGIDSILFHPIDHQVFYDLADLRHHKPTYIAQNYLDILKVIQQ